MKYVYLVYGYVRRYKYGGLYRGGYFKPKVFYSYNGAISYIRNTKKFYVIKKFKLWE